MEIIKSVEISDFMEDMHYYTWFYAWSDGTYTSRTTVYSGDERVQDKRDTYENYNEWKEAIKESAWASALFIPAK